MRAHSSLCTIVLLAGCAQAPPAVGPADASLARVPAPALEAQADLSGAVGLPRLYEIAYRDNPTLAAARHRWEAAIESFPIETALPEPMVEYAYGVRPNESVSGPMRHRVIVTQEIPFPTKLVAQGEVVEAEVRVAKAEFEIAVRDVLVEIAEAYYELWALDESRRVTLENQDLLRALLAHVTSEHAAGRAQFAEVQRAQSQLAQLDYDLVTLTELSAVQRTNVNALLSRSPSAAVGSPGSPPAPGGVALDLETLYAEAAVHLQELERDAARIEKADRQVELARQMFYPDLSLGVEYAETGLPEDEEFRSMPDAGMDDVYLMFGATLPVWIPKYQANVRRAAAERSAAEAERRADLDRATRTIAKTYFEMRNAARIVRLYSESLLPQAVHAMATAREWYEAGMGSYSHFLEMQQVTLNYRLAVIRATSDCYQNLVRLEAAVGRPLPELVVPLAADAEKDGSP